MLDAIIRCLAPSRPRIPITPIQLDDPTTPHVPVFPCFLLEQGAQVTVYLALDGQAERTEYAGIVHKVEAAASNSWLVTVWGSDGQIKFLSNFDGGHRIFETTTINISFTDWTCSVCGRERRGRTMARGFMRPQCKAGIWVWVVERYACAEHVV